MYENKVSCCGYETDYATGIARWAKVELLKEKVRQKLDAKYGSQIDKLADLIVEVVQEKTKSEDEFLEKQEKLDDAFEEFGA
jgi:hypothetical protein